MLTFITEEGGCFIFSKTFPRTENMSVIQSPAIIPIDFDRNIRLIQNFTEGIHRSNKTALCMLAKKPKVSQRVYPPTPWSSRNRISSCWTLKSVVQSHEADRKQDRIDLLFNKKNRRLRFYEAKHFSNGELWSAVGTRPKVVSQIKRYETQIAREKDQIINQYRGYVNHVNELFGCSLPAPEAIDEYVPLLAFGFDRDQLQGRIKKLLLEDKSLDGMRYYFVGNIDAVNIANMWDAIKCG